MKTIKRALFLMFLCSAGGGFLLAAKPSQDDTKSTKQKIGSHALSFSFLRGKRAKKPQATKQSDVVTNVTTASKQEEPHYDYFDDGYVRSVIADGYRYVLVGTGWSESSLGKMNVNNQEKQKRAFAMSFAQMMKINNLGGKGRLIYLTTSPINPDYRRYLFFIANKEKLSSLSEESVEQKFTAFEKEFIKIAYLSPKGRDKLDPDRTRYLSSDSNEYRRIKLPKALISLRQDRFQANKFIGFTGHFSGPYLEKIAEEWGLPYLINPSVHAHWIKKSKSRQSFRDAGVRHARGTYEPSFSKGALCDDIYALLKQLKHKKIILKLDESAAGYGNKVLRLDEIADDMTEKEAKSLIMKRLNDQQIFPEKFVARIEEANGGAIIEEFIDCQNYSSPASIYMINAENDISLRYTYDQLLGGKDFQVFQGSQGPISAVDYVGDNLQKMSEQVGRYLSSKGIRGTVGTDFVVCDADPKGEKRIAYAIENNVRMTGTSYPYFTLRTMIGEDLIQGKFIKSFDDCKIPPIAIKAFREKLQKEFYQDFLSKHPDTLDTKLGRGCVVHNDTFRIGKLGISCVADSREELNTIYESFTKSIYDYMSQHPIIDSYNIFKNSYDQQNWQKARSEMKQATENLFSDILFNKILESYDESAIPLEIAQVFSNRSAQQEFLRDLALHPYSLDVDKGKGCVLNQNLFKNKRLALVCVADSQQEMEEFHQGFAKEIRNKLLRGL